MKGYFHQLDFDVLEDLWKRSVPERFFVNAQTLKSHSLECPLIDLENSQWMTFNGVLRASLAIKVSPAKHYTGPDILDAHIHHLTFDDPKFAQELLDEALEKLKSKGIQKLIFGQDNRHLFPGVPTDWLSLNDFLQKNQVEFTEDQVDVESNLVNYEPNPETISKPGPDYSLRPCTQEDLQSLIHFFDQEFPGRWKYDCLRKWELEGPATILGAFHTPTQSCHGFALIQNEPCALPIGGAVWNQSLGKNWGSLGPIGVSKDIRGIGLGEATLVAGLAELKARGCQNTIIDWTTLVEFYARQGFKPSRTYKSASKSLV